MTSETTTSTDSITINGVTLRAPRIPRQSEVLTSEALTFLAALHRRFGDRIADLTGRGLLDATAGGGCGTYASSWHGIIEKHLIEPPSTVVRPRGLARFEDRVGIGDQPVSGGLIDYAIYIHRTVRPLLATGRAPYVWLPELAGEEELRLWQDLFVAAEEELGLEAGTIRAIRMHPARRVTHRARPGREAEPEVADPTGRRRPAPIPAAA